ncbi:MAG: hypothetical protein PVH50_11785 [Anaerolineae bacterium]|jgi:hypothetical protein
MKNALWIVVGMAAAVGLVVLGLGAGWAVWGQRLWAAERAYYMPMRDVRGTDGYCGSWNGDDDRALMGRSAEYDESCPAWADSAAIEPGSESLKDISIEEASEAIEAYLAERGYSHLEVAEVMEFEHNYYAIAVETDTGVGVMELLVDKDTRMVGPEMGPNMMWNTKYGMHGAGSEMERSLDTNAIPPDDAVEIANRWLDQNRQGIVAEEHADPFYGYYTLHTLKNGHIEGMLSVHGTTGEVWYHTWHGEFVQMTEHEDDH